MTNDQLVELARLCAEQPRVTTSKDVADVFRKMAIEYQQRAFNEPTKTKTTPIE